MPRAPTSSSASSSCRQQYVRRGLCCNTRPGGGIASSAARGLRPLPGAAEAENTELGKFEHPYKAGYNQPKSPGFGTRLLCQTWCPRAGCSQPCSAEGTAVLLPAARWAGAAVPGPSCAPSFAAPSSRMAWTSVRQRTVGDEGLFLLFPGRGGPSVSAGAEGKVAEVRSIPALVLPPCPAAFPVWP